MTKNKKILLNFLFSTIFFVFSSSIASASNHQLTSFEERPLCEKSNGIWREFGDGCANSCQAKFDQYLVCTRKLVYACDCGDNACWQDDKCVKISDYKKTFAELETKRNEELQAKKLEREEKLKTDPSAAYYMKNLYIQQQQQAAAASNAVSPGNKQNANNAQPIKQKPNSVQIVNVNSDAQLPTEPNQIAIKIPQQLEQRIPPSFLQQEEAQQKNPNPEGLNFPVVPLPTN